ncbi:Mitogen-activated protein kinase kinase kinase 5 [Lamellibrachia satsuma]|nr:Mitogen-activated protein kinase kinase kinase 5 [Lamellibrachia satsuma]
MGDASPIANGEDSTIRPCELGERMDVTVEPQLVQWLNTLGAGQDTIDKFVREQYTYSDVMELVTRDDLARLNLRGGMLCRIWRVIEEYRGVRPCHNGQPPSCGDHH